MKELKFRELKDINQNACYQVWCNGEFLGDLYQEKLTTRSKNLQWLFYPTEGEIREPIFWTLDCLEQLVNFIKNK